MTKRIELEIWDPNDLIPYAKNAKKHPAEQIDTLVGLMNKYGITVPPMVDGDEDPARRGVLIAGHGRRLALLQGKFLKTPVRVFYGYTLEEIDALRMADNRSSSNDYDTALLREEIVRLSDMGYEVAELGFSTQELEFLTEEIALIDESAFVDDVSGAVNDQKNENRTKQAETDAAAAPIADAFGFKRCTVEQSRRIRAFMSTLERETGKKGIEALLHHVAVLGKAVIA